MNTLTGKDKHDFTNNCLRIEILNKLILEQLDQKDSQLSAEYLNDLRMCLEKQLEFLSNLAN